MNQLPVGSPVSVTAMQRLEVKNNWSNPIIDSMKRSFAAS